MLENPPKELLKIKARNIKIVNQSIESVSSLSRFVACCGDGSNICMMPPATSGLSTITYIILVVES